MKETARPRLHPRAWSVTFLAMVLVTLLSAQPAFATTPSEGSGTFTFAATVTSSRTAGGNTFLTLTGTEAISGAITGAATVDFTQVNHSSGDSNSNGLITCPACIVGGRTGTAVFRFEGSGAFSTADPFAGQFVVLSASGGLSGLRGDGTFTAIDGGGTYTFRWHFDP
jgi:uncharacterized protein DUF3224